METKVTDFESIFIKLASPERILAWSHGEVTKPETINYRTQRSERNGLFDERIFGPEKDYECYCGKYRRVRYKGLVCEKCGVEVTRSIVRRERMGHIALAVPVSHIWFLRVIPSRMGLLLDVPLSDLENVIYFAGYIINKVHEDEKLEVLSRLDSEYKAKLKNVKTPEEKDNLKKSFSEAKQELDNIRLNKVLSEAEYYRMSLKYGEIFEAGIGAEAMCEIFKKINLEKLAKELDQELEKDKSQNRAKLLARLNVVKSMINSGVRPEWMFLTNVPVIPPALRPMVALDGGRHATSDINDLYRRVINRNNRLKKLIEIKAPEVICRNEKRILQEAVDALIDNSIRYGQNVAMSQSQKRQLKSLADMLKGKQGRFRQNLLGKRVDYSGRSVIVVGPELKLHQCGLPKLMALELFRPFIISQILKKELAFNTRGAGRLIEKKTPEVWAILEDVIKGKYILLNRAPTLHRLGIQAFQPVLIEGSAIQVHPLVCSAFNADFDGDQMAVHVPLGEEAQREAKEIMLSIHNLLKPGSGDPVVNLSQDMVVGCYWMTKVKEGAKGEGKFFSTPNEALTAYDFGEVDLRAKIKILPTDRPKYKIFNEEVFETTAGRLMFNNVLPPEFKYVNEELGKKNLGKIVSKLIREYDNEYVAEMLDKIKKFGFEYATKSGISWGMDDLIVPKEKEQIIKEAEEKANQAKKHFNDGLLTEDERYHKMTEIWQEARNRVMKLVPGALDPMGSVSSMVSSAARGSWEQVGQMSGMKGLMVNPSGKTIEFPVIPSYKEGLSPLEYFITTHGSRKGEVDTALKTAKAGYLTRRLIDVSQDVVVYKDDCKDDKGILISKKELEGYGKKMAHRIVGRVLARDVKDSKGNVLFKKGHLLEEENALAIETAAVEEIFVRSPISCREVRGICQMCYGYDLAYNKMVKMGEAVGIVAAQAIGEPGTQLTMRTFHLGGVARGGDITMGLPRVEEIFELRTPKVPAVICEFDGTVAEVKDKTKEKSVLVLANDPKEAGTESKEYPIPFLRNITVKKGDKVKRGGVITDGAIDIKILFAVGGKEAAQNYIFSEVDKVYTMQGAVINEKHIEVIVRQMFSRCRIKDEGETRFVKGKVIEKAELIEENEIAKKDGRKMATGIEIVQPISKVSLSSASFLAAASFQDTARVLIRSSMEGREDKLLGLKENVIIGRLIPAGTGFRRDYLKQEKVKGAEDEEDLEES